MRWYDISCGARRRNAGMRKSASWEGEFGKDYDIPKEVLSLVSNGLAEDTSWGNDLCPSFGHYDDDLNLRLWVEHPDPGLRIPGMQRFFVTHDNEDVVQTDDVDVAVKTYMYLYIDYWQKLNWTKKNEPANQDPEGRLWDLYHKGGKRTAEEAAEYNDLLGTLGRKPYMARVDKENKKS